VLLSAIVVDKKDNVATALHQLKKGNSISVAVEGIAVNIVLLQSIPFGHKLALENIKRGGQIIKYGEIIGQATVKINEGEHVHIHNVEGLRGRGDRP